jgi:hypothetical protein
MCTCPIRTLVKYYSENRSVLQDWMLTLPIRMQSTLVVSLRGPDGHSTIHIKKWVRWLRGLAFKPGNPSNMHHFMLMEMPPLLFDKSPLAYELYVMPIHFYSHLLNAVKVVALRHPDRPTAIHATRMMDAMCALLHLHNETPQEFEMRLGTLHWPGGKQPDTAQEAAEMLKQDLASRHVYLRDDENVIHERSSKRRHDLSEALNADITGEDVDTNG